MRTRSELKEEYRKLRPPMGVFVVRNLRSGRFQVHAALDLRAGMNRLRTELRFSSHRNQDLQEDWRTLGPEAFEIRPLDELAPRDAPGWTPGDDLEELASMWRERLAGEGGTPY
jgi:hypothetical protein